MMKKKRFRGNFQGEILVSVKDTQKDCNVNILQIIEIANRLTDENEQLKQLKQRCYEKIYDYNTLKCEFDNLQKENERLKQEVNNLMEDLGYINAELQELEDIDKNVIR